MNRTIGLVTTNYTIPNYSPLTDNRPSVAIPFGGRYRLLDFALSNMVNARIQTVGLITPHFYRSIMDHIGAGKEWGLDRKSGGLYILPGAVFGFRESDGRFLFRDMLHNLSYLEQGDADYVLVSSGSLVCNIDYQPLIDQHELSGDHVTLVYRKTGAGERRTGHYLTLDETGHVTAIERAGSGEHQFLNSFIINKTLFLRLARDFEALGYMNFIDLLAQALPDIRVGSWRFDGYIAFMDSIQDYFRSSMDLLRRDVRQELFNPDRQILTKIHDTPPALYAEGAVVKNSMITAGSIIEGTVENSVLFRSVRIEKGAVVKNCVLMEKCVIKAGAYLENVICDKFITVTENKHIQGTSEKPCVLPKGGVI